ncbi:unnamed protein product [Rangifer tarandus platyrhynchus]|uniref:Uncharacterized protein n=1 Tax=Rangifer tarandus platyrhynchus TaxID=3082113 RepID=A0AC60A2U4_RANTA
MGERKQGGCVQWREQNVQRHRSVERLAGLEALRGILCNECRVGREYEGERRWGGQAGPTNQRRPSCIFQGQPCRIQCLPEPLATRTPQLATHLLCDLRQVT